MSVIIIVSSILMRSIQTTVLSLKNYNIAIKDIKNLNSNNYKANSSITNLEQEKDVDQILQEGIGKVKGEDFYSEKNKSVVKKKETYAETEEERKCREALERQKQNQVTKNSSNLKIVGNDVNYLDKEETMIQIVREMDAYSATYNLPPLEISDSQWDLFFDITYNFFEQKGIEKGFYDLMSQFSRFVFAKSLLDKNKKISIYDFVKNLNYLEKQGTKKTRDSKFTTGHTTQIAIH